MRKEEPSMSEKLKTYPSTPKFRAKDSIGVPHPYCIGAAHVVWASDHHGGMLGESAIKDAEANGIHCDICKKAHRQTGRPILSFAEHQQAVLIEVDSPLGLNDDPDLMPYLLSIKERATKDGFVGFAFIKKG
jgi:hypothetical protein